MHIQPGFSKPLLGVSSNTPKPSKFGQTSNQFPLREDRFQAFHHNGQVYRDWSNLPLHPVNRPNDVYHGVVETPKNARNKLEVNRKNGKWYHDVKNGERRVNLLPAPADYGFLPQTLCEDDDSVDMFVLRHKEDGYHQESLHQLHPRAGEVKEVEIIGGLLVEDGSELDPKMIVEEVDDKQHHDIGKLSPTSPEWADLEDLKTFLTSYKPNASNEMKFPRHHWLSRAQAQALVENYHQAWQEHVKENPRPKNHELN